MHIRGTRVVCIYIYIYLYSLSAVFICQVVSVYIILQRRGFSVSSATGPRLARRDRCEHFSLGDIYNSTINLKKRTGRIDLFSYRGASANSEYRCCETTVPSRKRSTAAKSFNLVALPRQFSFVSMYYTVLSQSLVFRGSFKPTKVPSGVIAIVSKQQKKIKNSFR